jgi:hypothetical protein
MPTIRVVLDLTVGAKGELSGTVVMPDRREPVPFVGWLALMAMLEQSVAEPATDPQQPIA